MTERTYDPRTYDPRFDHRPTLLIWALATAVCVVLLVVAVFVSVQPVAPPSTTNANPAAVSDAGSSDYGYAKNKLIVHHAEVLAAEAMSAERHTQMVAAQR